MSDRERIELLMKCYELSPSQFADRTGIQRASVSHILSGRNKPSLEVMLKIYEAFPGIDMKWLMTGEGEAPSGQDTWAENAAGSGPLFAEEPAVPPIISIVADKVPVSTVQPQLVEETKPRRIATAQPAAMREKPAAEPRQRRAQANRVAQLMQLQPEKRIKEVRIFYTDGTYETLVPER